MSDYAGKSHSQLTYIGHANQWLQAFVPMVCESMNRRSVTARMKILRKSKKIKSEACKTTSINSFLTFYVVFTEVNENVVFNFVKINPHISLCRTEVHICGVIFKTKMRSLKRNQTVTVAK